ncbi:hypothetical protein CVT26_012538 [Gymnopilus dilepis]|uniref:Uncharacterized protein n=1 Tax=Gymnopilus dilepis TaxID=231916 RepID=A0A409WAP6_9AGAR|nr:hypothetical protein CVT26_012538 [Gymnopilus dilepis]
MDVMFNMRCASQDENELKETAEEHSDERGRTMALPTHLVERIPTQTAEKLDILRSEIEPVVVQ